MTEIIPASQFARLPDAYQRRARQIATRISEIDATFRPATPTQTGEALKQMRKHFRPQPDTDVADMAQGFRDACRDLPEWAVREAANDFLAGRVDNHTGQFMPTCAEFAKRVREIMTPFLTERHSLRIEASKLLERALDEESRIRAEIDRSNPAVRQRVSRLIDDFTKGEPVKQSVTHIGLSDERQKQLDALKKPREFQSKIGHRPSEASGGE